MLFSLSLFEKISHPRHLFVYFRLFKQTLQFLKQIYVNKCRSSIWCMDSNPRPSEHESPPRAPASRSSFSFSLFLSSLSLSLCYYISLLFHYCCLLFIFTYCNWVTATTLMIFSFEEVSLSNFSFIELYFLTMHIISVMI